LSDSGVSVIGLGPMGRAMARTFLAKGRPVTVWNRTAERAADLVAQGAARAASTAEAVRAHELVLISLTDYDAMYAVLAPAAHALPGRVVVNLSSDTPQNARTAASWMAERGARYLVGGVTVPPSGIGAPGSTTYYSGPADVLDAHRAVLEELTAIDYRGDDPGLAMLYFQLAQDLLWTSALGYLHALAVADANGVSAQQFLPYAASTLTALQELFGFYTPRIDAGQHPGDVERLAMGLANADHVLRTSEEAGVDITLPAAVREIFRRGIAHGRADDSVTSLIEVLRSPGLTPG
jgi:3-hydroxyisobutyrate dehydrogenase-like beta-hydroxyacid dehydrogenase